MTKTEFLQYLKRQNINENLFVLDNSTRDGYCLKKTTIVGKHVIGRMVLNLNRLDSLRKVMHFYIY